MADRLVARYECDPYGRIVGPDTNAAGKFDAQDDPGFYAAANPFRWSTKRFDPETGSPQRISPQAELSDFGRRYYSATLGRWLNRDPIGDFATANLVRHSESRRRRTFSGLGGANVYAYVGNNPTNRTDYLGLASAKCRPGEPCLRGPFSGGSSSISAGRRQVLSEGARRSSWSPQVPPVTRWTAAGASWFPRTWKSTCRMASPQLGSSAPDVAPPVGFRDALLRGGQGAGNPIEWVRPGAGAEVEARGTK
ncbi:MAG: RHS repeat-associated core domain-containing protein [Planctomycetota bacterium]